MLQLFARWTDEHVPHEEGMIGAGADDAHLDAVLLVPAREAIDNVDTIPSVEVVNGALAIDAPNLAIMLA